MFRYKSLSISSMMSVEMLQRRLQLIQLQLIFRLNHILVKRSQRSDSPRNLKLCNIASNYINHRVNGIHAGSFLHSKQLNKSFAHSCIQSFGSECRLEQKHRLEPSIAENEAKSRSHSLECEHDADNPFLATLKVNQELLRSGTRSCRHIELDISKSNMQYEPGDHIGIYPTNESELVEKLGRLCDANLDAVIPAELDSFNNRSLTYRAALQHHIEIAAIPEAHVLKALSEHCSDESDRKFLNSITSATPDGNELYESWILQAQRNIVHILEDIKSCRPPIEFICRILPRLQPRYYSISSSSRLHPTAVHMTVVLVKYETKTGRIRKGVASAFLATKNPDKTSADGPQVPVFIRKSNFHLPESMQTPIIMIGTGTGLAPFLGFIQERNHYREKEASIGETILYFGARKRHEDFIYEKELGSFVENGTLKIRTAFSRDQPEKIYVTHLMQKDADLIWQVIDNMGHVYICGDARHMAHDVRSTLVSIIKTKGTMDEASAEDYLKNMESQKRYSVDVWS